MTKRKSTYKILNHTVLHIQSHSPKYKEGASFPPLPFHEVVSFAAVHIDDAHDPTWFTSTDPEEDLLEDLNQVLAIKDSHLVTMYGRSYTVPLLLQRYISWGIRSPNLYDIYHTPDIGRQHKELLDVLTCRGGSQYSKMDEYCGGLFGLKPLGYLDVEGLIQRGSKPLLRSQVYSTFRIASLWLRELLVRGTIKKKVEEDLRKRMVKTAPKFTRKKLLTWSKQMS